MTKEAQELFDALSRTMQCRWQGKAIVVVDAMVSIEEPYVAESCKSLPGGQGERALGRIRKMVSSI